MFLFCFIHPIGFFFFFFKFVTVVVEGGEGAKERKREGFVVVEGL
jgi:hypothetical protein